MKQLTDYLGKARNRIAKLGIELEGGWTRPLDIRIEHDGSVQLNVPVSIRGEAVSEPMEVDKWQAWVRKYYPDAVNATCGLHVHMSFRSSLTYQRLMTAAFQEALLKQLSGWARKVGLPNEHPIWPRLRGRNGYCQARFLADEQASSRQKGANRYTALNFCHALHGTLECRVLPMFLDIDPVREKVILPEQMAKKKAIPPEQVKWQVVKEGQKGVDLAIGAIQTVLDTTNAFLLTQNWHERPSRLSLLSEGSELEPLQEEQRIAL
jgi:hypothetical protein